ncbi:LLM class flavin-dependent oxidoreductase [Dermatobacter hominis]|uniref:LLM class flavin-dependent oxidoreductase n=1 Tax=Dermatobacter hominis TaxID=2884263 RepID=UPI001D1158FC|nr:LLM class flavin-dependent oxidoreductase [Dermatobacter hominis]UDY35105.1 LLM class flavin-dependent oxidoreductase [Dermatobacter hominis]
MPIRVAVQAAPSDAVSWSALATALDDDDAFHALYAADHPGATASPFVALAAAAGATERIRLGTCVVNAGCWEPLQLAAEVATLDVVSAGRALLGVGAGHTPAEWAMRGLDTPSGAARVDRLVEVVDATVALLAGGAVSCRGDHVSLVDAVLDAPRPVQDPVPLLVGGNGPRVLEFAGRRADVVGITGLGRTLADGHRHEVDWSPAALVATAERVAAASTGRPPPELEALVQLVVVTDDAEQAAAEASEAVPGASAADLLRTPFAWIGTVEEIAAQLERFDAELGLARYVVREHHIEEVRAVVGALDARIGA